MIEVEVTNGYTEGQHLKTNSPFVSIGRSPEHTIVVADRSVSRHHGEIVLLDNRYQYRDLNSTHGTVLRRADEDNFIRQVVLNEGDELILGRTNNVIRVVRIMADTVQVEAEDLTMMHASEDAFGPPEQIFANDSKALRTIVAFDSKLMESNITSERDVLEELLEHIPQLFDNLTYVALLEVQDDEVHPYDYRILRKGAKVRLSTSLTTQASARGRAFVFRVSGGDTLETDGGAVSLSRESQLIDESETTETLDAPFQGVDYTIPFGLIASIVPPGAEQRGAQRASVTLHDGEELQLELAGDLGDGNAGMLVFVDGPQRPEYVRWTDVERLDLDRPPAMYPSQPTQKNTR